jgi:hypothetical protein
MGCLKFQADYYLLFSTNYWELMKSVGRHGQLDNAICEECDDLTLCDGLS